MLFASLCVFVQFQLQLQVQYDKLSQVINVSF